MGWDGGSGASKQRTGAGKELGIALREASAVDAGEWR